MQEKLVERFMRYTSITSESNSVNEEIPSTPGQRVLATVLAEELTKMGFVGVSVDQHSICIGHLPANDTADFMGTIPTIGFVAHLDTVSVNLRPSIRPKRITYTGGDICLNEEQQIMMKISEHPELQNYIGQELLVTDGLSVLGADNKAAIASIMTAMQMILDTNTPHGDIYVAFVPDEEIGLRGSKKIDFSKFPVAFAYTVDSCELGEVVYETFNAGTAVVTIHGISAHPMSAKGVLVNPTLCAVDFINCFNRLATPENTAGTEGYIWPQSMTSNQSQAIVTLNIRDHSKILYEGKKDYVRKTVAFLQERYPRANVELSIEDTYGNIKDALTEENKFCIDYIYEAMDRLHITPKTLAMRGGTDGSYISTKGIPTPNFFTGAHNFHSQFEFLPLPSFEKSCLMVMEIIKLVYEQGICNRK